MKVHDTQRLSVCMRGKEGTSANSPREAESPPMAGDVSSYLSSYRPQISLRSYAASHQYWQHLLGFGPQYCNLKRIEPQFSIPQHSSVSLEYGVKGGQPRNAITILTIRCLLARRVMCLNKTDFMPDMNTLTYYLWLTIFKL